MGGNKYLSEKRAQELIDEVKNRLNGKVSLAGATMTGTLEAPVLRAGNLAENNSDNLFEIGNGVHDNDTGVDTRKNVFAVDKDGNVNVAGDIVDGEGNKLSDVIKKATSAYIPKGTIEYDDLPTPSADKLGYTYNVVRTVTDGSITEQTYFTIDDRFVEYDPDQIKTYPSGTNVVIVEEEAKGGLENINVSVSAPSSRGTNGDEYEALVDQLTSGRTAIVKYTEIPGDISNATVTIDSNIDGIEVSYDATVDNEVSFTVKNVSYSGTPFVALRVTINNMSASGYHHEGMLLINTLAAAYNDIEPNCTVDMTSSSNESIKLAVGDAAKVLITNIDSAMDSDIKDSFSPYWYKLFSVDDGIHIFKVGTYQENDSSTTVVLVNESRTSDSALKCKYTDPQFSATISVSESGNYTYAGGSSGSNVVSQGTRYAYDVYSGFIDLSDVSGTVEEITAAELAAMWKDDGILIIDKNTVVLSAIDATSDVTVTATTGSITAESSDTGVATVSVDSTGTDPVVTITAVAAGTATVTITAAESSGYKTIAVGVDVTCSF